MPLYEIWRSRRRSPQRLWIHRRSTREQRWALELANEPQSCFAEERAVYGLGDAREKRENERFGLTSTDTLPYWYAPLGQLFAVSALDVADRAEHWIVDRLAFTDDDAWNDQRELSRESRYHEVRNDHGHMPLLETVRTYLEYHGMLLAAGQMCDEGMPVVYEGWDDDSGPWQEWVGRHRAAFPRWWIADLRTPSPQEPFVYVTSEPIEQWLTSTPHDFDRQLLVERDGEVWVNVHSFVRLEAPDRYASCAVRVALVAPETAASLMRAYQSASEPSDYFLPHEDADEFSPGRAESRTVNSS